VSASATPTSSNSSIRPDTPAGIDFIMMYAIHCALRRDLRRLSAAALAARDGAPGADARFRAVWTEFAYFLDIHHKAEDAALWPLVRDRVLAAADKRASARVALLDAMEDEHEAIDPALAGITAALDAGDRRGLLTRIDALDDVLRAHLKHEEDEALPLIDVVLSTKDWADFVAATRRQVGVRQAPRFFPWLLDDLDADLARRALGAVPPPVRVLCRAVWLPRYRRRLARA
jgi:hemerythrin-like domain-containing protein